MKSVYDNTILQLEEVRRQNKTLSQKTKDIMNQISEGGHSIYETKSGSALRLRSLSLRLPCPRPRPPWSRRRTRC